MTQTHRLLALTFCFYLIPATVFAVGETLEIFNDTKTLAMGGATTAESRGILSNFQNPAGLARARAGEHEVNIADLQGIGGTGLWGPLINAQSPGIQQVINAMQNSANRYSYGRLSLLTSWATRGLSVGAWGSYQFAGESDGTNFDVVAGTDYGLTVGLARNFAGNLVKLGVSGKAILRNELRGRFAHADVSSQEQINQAMREGYAFGADVGVIITLPYHSLPTIAVSWRDVWNTNFTGSNFVNSSSTVAPESIEQSINAGVSLNPAFNRWAKLTFSIELKHIQNPGISFRKKWHAGMQVVLWQTHYLWVGMNQFNPTGGVGMRLPGGHFELGTYGEDVGSGSLVANDRRYFFRYTISL